MDDFTRYACLGLDCNCADHHLSPDPSEALNALCPGFFVGHWIPEEKAPTLGVVRSRGQHKAPTLSRGGER